MFLVLNLVAKLDVMLQTRKYRDTMKQIRVKDFWFTMATIL